MVCHLFACIISYFCCLKNEFTVPECYESHRAPPQWYCGQQIGWNRYGSYFLATVVNNHLFHIGLKIHDIWAETSEDITKATHRLPYEIQEARYRRMIRAGDILVKRKFWNKQQRAELDVMDVSLFRFCIKIYRCVCRITCRRTLTWSTTSGMRESS